MEIKLLSRQEIDDKRWNGCIHFALNAPPYGYTWYLDNVCEEWMGLVHGNYKWVMPLVFSKKWGISYIYQPFFTQQLGLYGESNISQEVLNEFLSAIPAHFKWVEMSLNENNFPPNMGLVTERDNYLLDLKTSYELTYQRYSGNILRKLKKAQKEGLFIQTQIKPETFVDFYKKHTAPKIERFEDKHYYSMLRIIYQALQYNMGILLGVENTDGKLMAVNFLLNHPQRIINLLPSSSEEGNEQGAMAFLLDYVVKTNEGQNKFLDFEGSMIEGIANFYKGFGAKKVAYYHIKMNHLPKILRIFKK